jgi:hypothetical protein
MDQRGLFRAKKQLFWSKMCFQGSKRTFLGVNKPFEINRDFPGPEIAIYSKICFHSETKKYQERLVLVKIGPF